MNIKIAGCYLLKLAGSISDKDCKITAEEILEELTCRLISKEHAEDIRAYLNWLKQGD